MLRLTLAQMRRSLGRLAAAGVAIGIGTAFVTATLLAGAAMTRTTYDAVTTTFADADLVVVDGEITQEELEAVRGVPQVAAVHGYDESGVELVGPSGQGYVNARAAAPAAALEAAEPAEGGLPDGRGQIVLPQSTATLLGVQVGDTVDATQTGWRHEAGVESARELHEELTVVGVLGTADATFMGTGGVAIVDGEQLRRWLAFQDPDRSGPADAADSAGAADPLDRHYWYALLAVDDGASVQAVQTSVAEAVGAGLSVRTVDEHAKVVTDQLTGNADQLTAVVLGFAAVALLVASLVISNTFQVLVAQRTRTLALLRCVGADRAQLRRSVVLEALVVGVTASAAGLAVGVVVVQVVLLVLDGTATDVPLPSTVSITPAVVLAPMLLGTAVTVVAALAPARAATRVSPLAALRPSATPRLGETSGRVRGVLASLLVVGGVGLLVLGMVVTASSDNLTLGLGVGLLGGAASFLGVVIGAVFWVPRLVGSTGRLLGRSATARLAAANSVRNPRRTAATSSALFIGVTLVAMMATGAGSTRTALDQALGEEFPVDVAVSAVGDGWDPPPLPQALAEQVRALAGVQAVVELTGTTVELVQDGARTDAQPDGGQVLEVRGVEPSDAGRVVHAPEQLAGLTGTTVLVPEAVAGWTGIVDGQELMLRHVGRDSAAPGTVTVTAVLTDLPSSGLLLTPETVQALDDGAPVSRLWVALTDLDDAEGAVAAISRAASDTGETLETVGAAVERAFYQRVVSTLLAIVVGLLGVAVVIALVGVANTLSLSVLERRRESATLRALGLTRSQLRGTLAIEGMLIAGVGSVVGAALGTVYGWAGARTLLGSLAEVGLTVPWRDLGVVVLVGVVAGLLASVLPGLRAARTSPVEALAVE